MAPGYHCLPASLSSSIYPGSRWPAPALVAVEATFESCMLTMQTERGRVWVCALLRRHGGLLFADELCWRGRHSWMVGGICTTAGAKHYGCAERVED